MKVRGWWFPLIIGLMIGVAYWLSIRFFKNDEVITQGFDWGLLVLSLAGVGVSVVRYRALRGKAEIGQEASRDDKEGVVWSSVAAVGLLLLATARVANIL